MCVCECLCPCVCVHVYVCACADLEEQEIQELLAEQEGDREEVEQRSKRIWIVVQMQPVAIHSPLCMCIKRRTGVTVPRVYCELGVL